MAPLGRSLKSGTTFQLSETESVEIKERLEEWNKK
jgi:hypothetical protein